MVKQSFWMLFAAFLFTLMAVCVKWAVDFYSVYEIIFYRSLFGVALCFCIVQKGGIGFATPHPFRHAVRCALGTTCISLGVYILSVLPIATAQTLCYTSPLFFCLFLTASTLIAREKPEWSILLAVLVGFGGMLLILRPSFSPEETFGALMGILTGVTGGAADFMIRNLSQHREPKERIVFYFTLCGTLFGLSASIITGWHSHTVTGVMLLLGIGLTATIAQLSLTAAWSLGHSLLNSIFQFSAIPFAVIFGILFFGERPDVLTFTGISIVTGAGLIASVLRLKKEKSVSVAAK